MGIAQNYFEEVEWEAVNYTTLFVKTLLLLPLINSENELFYKNFKFNVLEPLTTDFATLIMWLLNTMYVLVTWFIIQLQRDISKTKAVLKTITNQIYNKKKI